MSKITEVVAAIAGPIVAKNDCELWDVEYIKEVGEWYLRVYIDRPGGVSIAHCEAVSRELDPILDEHEDLIPGAYTFEVSSAGAERHLRRPSDFERFTGHYVELKLYKAKDGQKIYHGNLAGWSDGSVELDISGVRKHFEKEEIASVRLKLK